MPAKKPRHNMSTDTITISGAASSTDSLTVSENAFLDLDLGNYNSAMSALTSSDITFDYGSISSNYIPTGTITTSTFPTGTSTTVPYTYSTGTNWVNPATVYIDDSGLAMKKGADIKIGGKSLTEAIEKIEQRLGILNPNPELEDRWEQLKELRTQYLELEKDLLEKEKIMKILKES